MAYHGHWLAPGVTADMKEEKNMASTGVKPAAAAWRYGGVFNGMKANFENDGSA